MSRALVRIFVPAVAEFAPLVQAAQETLGCRVSRPSSDYHLLESDVAIEFRRRSLGFRPALWYGMFTGGVRGKIEVFDRDVVRVAPVV